MTTINEPRALSAALSGPTFHTRGADRAMHVANRHVERWAPETGASRVRSMSSLGFVDRLVAPWIETAQRSASMRLFQQYTRTGASEREGGAVSWVFPRPWYQDELDWMTAARQVQTTTQEEQAPAPRLLTTRGTYVPPATASASIMPAALYEYVAPSLSIAAPAAQDRISGVGHGGSHADAYSPLVSLAAVQAAHVMSRTVGAFAGRTGDPGASRMAPALRSVLTTMLARAARGPEAVEPTRAARFAPELVTPPAPRPDRDTREAGESLSSSASAETSEASSPSTQLADQYAEQRAQIVELQRLARRTAASTLSSSAVEASSAPDARTAEVSAVRTADVSAARTAEARTAEARVAAAITAEAQVAAARTREARVADARTTEERVIERAEARVRERTELEQRERTEERVRAVDAQRRVVQQVQAEQVERSRADAPRGQARLHEQSRADAAVHARTLGDVPSSAARPSAAPIERVAEMRAPAEVAAAIAALPPQLQSFIGQRPGRAMEAISELQDVLRTAELLARSSASGGTMEVTRGPRMMMPAGLGGLVAAVDRAPLLAPAQPALAPLALNQAQPQSTMAMTAAPARRDVRAPALPWLAAPRTSAPANALQATSTAHPAALTHVAWADRWLARFAGASAQSLEVLHASASGSPHVRMQALAAAAPGEVFVAPVFDSETVRGLDRAPARDLSAFTGTSDGPISVPAQARASAPSMSAPPVMAAGPMLRPEAPLVERYADDAETPDDVFLQIAAAAATRRTQPMSQGGATAAGPSASTSTSGAGEPTRATERATVADMVAHAAPSAPGAGLSAQLASSPFASALRHVLPLPAAASFDIRALFADGLSSTYLAGLLAPASHEIEIASSVTPAFTTQFQARELAATREIPAWDATYVTPELGGVDAEASRFATTESGEASRFAAASADPAELAAIAQLEALTASTAAATSMASPAGTAARADQAVAASPELRALIEATAPLTTLRSALLSWTAEIDAAGAPIAGSASSPVMAGGRSSPVTTGTARAMIDAMALPMLTETSDEHERASAWTSPGMVGGRAHAWSVAQERSASDLSLDFVTPELVLAARVYGLGPAEAAQAARLALAGPGQLTAMAGAVDRTFVQAMAIEAERRRSGDDQRSEFASPSTERRAPRGPATVASMPAALMPGGLSAAGSSPASGEPSVAGGPLATAYPLSTGELVAATARPALGTSSFGIERRPPRGAFLWPSATIAALGMTAASPEGEQSMSVAALELLAAQAVAEIGTFAALGEYGPRGEQGDDDGVSLSASSASSAFGGSSSSAFASATGAPGAVPPGAAVMPSLVGASVAASSASGRDGAGAEPAEADVLGAVAALVPSARRARFEAMYVALSESPSGRSWSPAARAARALALAGRGDDAPTSAYARAAAAWDVMPVVYAADGRPLDGGGAADEVSSGGGSRGAMTSAGARFTGGGRGASRTGGATRDVVGPTVAAEMRPGLSGLSARAGEALGSYVSPAAAEASRPAARAEAEPSVYQRAPSAAQELVRTGRPAGRHGGGEAEIPAWFEKAARKMLDERSGASDGISLAELTLVSAAPASQVAASSVTAAPAPSATPAAAAKPGDEEEVDVDKLADEIFRQIMVMMDSARARNGEPYL